MNLTIEQCRACQHPSLLPILSLGSTPLANALLTEAQLAQPEAMFPLDLVFCPQCSLVQITVTVPPEKLFREYFYLSSFSDTMLQNAREVSDRLIHSRGLDSTSLAMEIASNDGYLLQNYVRHDIPVLGIEPARNIAQIAEDKGVRTRCEFFGPDIAAQLRDEGQLADVIHANNVLAHVADLKGVVAGFATVLKPAGVVVVEAPYVKDMIDCVEFDTIYHEHLCYFSLTALARLFRQHGLAIVDVERLPIHGGSLRIFAMHQAAEAMADAAGRARVHSLLAEEQQWGVENVAFYQAFASRVAALRADLLGLLHQLKADGKRIAVYGASAKGSTLLNYFGIGRETLEYVVDRSTVKQGHYTPGTHLPIYAPAHLLTDQPDYVLLLTWNFAAEILEQQAAYRQRGGQFILPIPDVQVV